ncbi:putative DNA polymerase 1 [Escherichia phage YD-2008.s]|uniref:Putative DNA polymerase 1 n=1 Tax=Escherichia phage YD-2008.s TaxID=1567004 RepID=A0A0A7DVE4_9CAUD|nr:putative DNA polymerase 1 [Escherichia phage YD-2008.s]AIX11842.1 putative DNA polymerase 1 [Escherichia phage YD-2008.s]
MDCERRREVPQRWQEVIACQLTAEALPGFFLQFFFMRLYRFDRSARQVNVHIEAAVIDQLVDKQDFVFLRRVTPVRYAPIDFPHSDDIQRGIAQEFSPLLGVRLARVAADFVGLRGWLTESFDQRLARLILRVLCVNAQHLALHIEATRQRVSKGHNHGVFDLAHWQVNAPLLANDQAVKQEAVSHHYFCFLAGYPAERLAQFTRHCWGLGAIPCLHAALVDGVGANHNLGCRVLCVGVCANFLQVYPAKCLGIEKQAFEVFHCLILTTASALPIMEKIPSERVISSPLLRISATVKYSPSSLDHTCIPTFTSLALMRIFHCPIKKPALSGLE